MFTVFAPLVTSLLFQTSFVNTPDLWDAIDAQVHHDTLCEAFRDGATYTFRRKSCLRFGCDQWDYTVKTFCETPADGSPVASVEHWKHGSVFSRQELSDSAWRQLHGNLLRSVAASVESFGQTFSLERVEKTNNGTLLISYSIRSGSTVREQGVWVLGEGPTIPQVQERRAVRFFPVKEETSDIYFPQAE